MEPRAAFAPGINLNFNWLNLRSEPEEKTSGPDVILLSADFISEGEKNSNPKNPTSANTRRRLLHKQVGFVGYFLPLSSSFFPPGSCSFSCSQFFPGQI